MKIWTEFGSSHSENITIIGTFETSKDANEALEIVEDITLSSWEGRFANIKEFEEKWKEQFPWVQYRLTNEDLESGIDNTPDIEINNEKITISSFRNSQISGIIKVLMAVGASDISIKQ